MRQARVVLFAAVAALVAVACPGAASAQDPDGAAGTGDGRTAGLTVTVVSSPRPDVVTGGDALLRVSAPGGVALAGTTVAVGGRDVTRAFAAQPDGSLLGLVTGLRLGHNPVTARITAHPDTPAAAGLADRPGTAVLDVVNHPVTGPVFSGPQQEPFTCETTVFGLAPAVGPLCAAPTVVGYRYMGTDGTVHPLADRADRPADLAYATVDGRRVPYVIRLEQGTIDRAVYQIAALDDGTDPSPYRTAGAWNRRLVYTFGGGCNVGYHQGASTGGGITDGTAPLFLAQGYAVATSTLNVLDNNCSTIISAEVAMMVKEHFIEEYGPVAHTIGWGGSGGAIQQYGIADNYPGILDGIIPQVSFPDATTTTATVGDCRLLRHYFDAAGGGYTPAQRAAVSGFGTWDSCVNWDRSFASRGNATEACPPAIPAGQLWDPVTNPDGIRCTAAEQLVNQLGRDPRTGFARGYVDNVGIEYGLAALRAGQITPEQFVDLNEKVGGYDVAGNLVPARTSADPVALERLYRSGLALAATGGLTTTPVIDLRAYTDPGGDIHTRFWSFAIRQRLVDATGSAASQAMLVYPYNPRQAGEPQFFALSAMDRWLTAIDADGSGTAREKVLRDRPADLTDGCWVGPGTRLAGEMSWHGTGTCDRLFRSYADTRIAAGAPLRDDVLKCRLRPLDFAAYPVTFTAVQQDRLRAVFPDGVCDYSGPGVGAAPLDGVWQFYGPVTGWRGA